MARSDGTPFAFPDKRRPVLVLARNDVVDHLNEVIVVPATRTIRGLTTEVVLTPDDGMPAACALELRSRIVGATESHWYSLVLPETRWPEVQRALLIACGFGSQEAG